MDAVQSSAENSPSTAATTPEQVHSLPSDDIWASDDEVNFSQAGTEQRSHEALLSDLPILKRQHMTDGYREGLGIGKAQVMQKGFDQGYPTGIRIGIRAGKVLGILEGIVVAKGIRHEMKVQVEKLLDQARQELHVPNLMNDLNDEQLMASSDIPARIEAVLAKWESAVIGKANDKSESEGL